MVRGVLIKDNAMFCHCIHVALIEQIKSKASLIKHLLSLVGFHLYSSDRSSFHLEQSATYLEEIS